MLLVHRASRSDLLVDGLAGVLTVPPEDPFSPEVVAVPTRGVERWLAQRLALSLGTSEAPVGASGDRERRTDGISANIAFPSPTSLISETLGAATGLPAERDPWAPERAVWPLVEVVEERIDEPWLSTLAAHLGRSGEAGRDSRERGGRRWSTLRHLAGLFDRYGTHRPALIRWWAEGHDVDSQGVDLPPDLAWQARLWRELRLRIDVPSPPERLGPACDRLYAEPGLLALPDRLSLFGLTRLAPTAVAVLDAIAAHRDVHLWLLHPSDALWSRTSRSRPGRPTLGPRAHDEGLSQARHPLLDTWGRDARELQTVLTAAGARDAPPVGLDRAAPAPRRPQTLLGRLQAAIEADSRPPAEQPGRSRPARPLLKVGDRSLQIHACHGQARQVEVLRDVILGLFDDDPTLEPRDVIVMCPDIDRFAPLIQATFGPGQERSGRDLRVRLADRSVRQTNPLLTALGQLLDLAAGRLGASAVLDFAGSAPVRRRFELDDEDLSRVEEWVRATGVHWGLDAGGRAPYQLASVAAGTWASGLDRLLLGVAMSDDGLPLFGGALPLDDVGSNEVERAGRLAELVDRIGDAAEELRGAHPLARWLDILAAAADRLFEVRPSEDWQRAELQAILNETAEDAAVAATSARATTGTRSVDDGDGPQLSLAEVRSLLAHRLAGRPTRASFRTGHLTMCTLMPMRSVPHRVVCLLGLDDGVFPRRPASDGDDVLDREPWVGDRDPASEDRQLLLDALLAAGQHLVITYAGRDERTNAVRPPCVPVGELLDVLDATVRTKQGAPARASILVDHPLQSWDTRNFTPGALGQASPASFDQAALAGARAAAEPRRPSAAVAGIVLPPDGANLDGADPVDLDDLVDFLRRPVRAFLDQRLGVRPPDGGTEVADGLPLALDGPARRRIGERLLAARLAGVGRTACRDAELARGEVPPLRLGEAALDEILRDVDALVGTAGWASHQLRSLEVSIDLGGRQVLGTVVGLDGHTLSSVTYARLGPAHRLAAWVRLLALSAAEPDGLWDSRTIGLGERRSSVARQSLPPLGDDPRSRAILARCRLAELVDLFDRGRREALPLFCRTSEAWAAATRRGRSPDRDARAVWSARAGTRLIGEDNEPAHLMVFDGLLPFDDLVRQPPALDEDGEGWCSTEVSRLGRLARRLWDPLLDHEASA